MDWTALRERVVEHFNDGELRDLCFDLNIDYESLPGATKVDKTRELILFCRRLDRIDALLDRCQQLRPHAAWEDLDAGSEIPLATTESDPPPRATRAGGDIIMATVGAGASNVAVGKDVYQRTGGEPGDDRHATLEAGMNAVDRALQNASVAEATAAMATFQLTLLRGELLKGRDEQPSASTIVQVGDWLLANLPALREPMAALFTTPAAMSTLQRAGPRASSWATQQFTRNA